jgi:hypothetical protein
MMVFAEAPGASYIVVDARVISATTVREQLGDRSSDGMD